MKTIFTKKLFLIAILIAAGSGSAAAQTLFVPSGTGGIGASSQAGKVGVGTATPAAKAEIASSEPYTLYLSGYAPSLYFGGISGTFPNGSGNPRAGFLGFSTLSGSYGQGQGDLNLATQSRGAGNTSAINFLVPSDDSGNYQLAAKITRTGQVGIGTASPQGKLTISGSGGSVSSGGIEWFSTGNTSGYSGWGGRIYVGSPTGGWGTAPFHIAVPDGSGNEIRALTIQNGNVGIGTSSPASALHVKRSGQHVVATFEGGDTNGVELDLNANTSGGYRYKMGVIDASHPWGSGFYLYSVPNANLSFFIDGDTNNVGIGTYTPTQKLSVNGAIRAKEVIVDTNWSDFVFADDYRLPSLEEVADHIQAHKHLPGVPSAAQVQENGLPVGEAQTIMMQKIEELTLYMLQLKQANEALQTRVRELEARQNRE